MDGTRLPSTPEAVKSTAPNLPPDVRLGVLLGQAAIVAISGRDAIYVSTWGALKRAVESKGVRDDDVLAMCDFGAGQGTGYVHVERDEHGAVEIREIQR